MVRRFSAVVYQPVGGLAIEATIEVRDGIEFVENLKTRLNTPADPRGERDASQNIGSLWVAPAFQHV